MPRPADPRPGQPAEDGPLYPELSLDPPPPPQPSAGREPRAAGEWIAHIREQDMPAVGATVALVHAVTEDERASTDRLAQVILQDPAMTTKVLKLANSAFYNPARQGISTISRAIVVLGFNIVAEIAIGIRLVDAVLSGGVRQRVLAEMAQSFHAAVQARAIASLRRDKRSEEVFIAALLSRVGEMAFWCFGGQAAMRLDRQLENGEQTPEEAQMTVLGFRLRQLSVGLAREWKLGPLLQSVLEGSARPTPTEQAIRFGQRLAAELENGWDTPGSRRLVSELAGFVGMSDHDLRLQLAANSREAARIASYYGADEAARCIPLAGRGDTDPEPEAELVEPCAVSNGPDPQLQLRILRELSGRIAMGANLNEVLQLVLEGIFRGVGFDRVLFALITANRQQLVAKTCLGAGGEALRQRFIFSLDSTPGDVFNEFFRKPRALRIEPGRTITGVRVDRLQLVTNTELACMAPILAQGRAIGVFYADRQDPARGIDDESFEAFQLFVQQVSLALAAAAPGGRAP